MVGVTFALSVIGGTLFVIANILGVIRGHLADIAHELKKIRALK